MTDTPASIVVTPPPPSSNLHAAADVAEQINLDLHSAAANATLIPPSIGSSPLSNSPSQTPAQNPALVPGAVPAISLDSDPSPSSSSANVAPPPPQQSLSGSSTLPSGEAPALIELEPLPDGATQQIPASALGQRNDGAHISIVRDSKGHFFRRIIHSASSSSSRSKKRSAAGGGATSGDSTPSSKKKRHHHRSSQPTYGLGHSRGAPVIIRAGQHGYPYTFPQYQSTASAPVSRMNSRKEGAPAPAPAPRSVHGRESAEITGGGPRSSGTNTPAPPSRRSHEHHHHHHHHRQHAPPRRQDPSQLIGLGRANPLSGLMGSANPNRAFLASASASASPYQALSRTTTGTERRSLDSAPIPHSQAPILSDAEIARIAAALGGGGLGASPQPQLLSPPNSINPELLTALRDIIRQEVGSAHAVHAEQHQQQIVDEIQALGRDGPVEVEAEAESSPHTDDTLSIPERSKQQQQQQQQQQRQQQPSDSIRAERGIEDTNLPPLSEKAVLDPPAVAQSDDMARRSFESGKSSLSSVAAAAGGGGEGGRRSRTRSISSSIDSSSSSSSSSRGSSSDGDELEFPNPWAKFRYCMREPFAEFLGTCVFIIFGNGVNNQVFVSQMYDSSAPKGDYLSVSFGWGIGVAFGIWIAGGISGGHLNPCVTLALAVYRGFPWRKVPVYIVSQILGATVGALLIYGLYCNPIRVVDPNQTETTAALFTTFPADYLRTPTTRPTAFYNEVLATAVLLIIVLAIGDAANTPPPDGLAPLALMWAVVGLGATLGWQTAYALNIARDLGPRLALQIVGYSPKVLWSFNAYYFLWTPMLGAVVGALLGGFIYDALLYTGGESPLNRQWKWSDVRWARHSKKKLPAGVSCPGVGLLGARWLRKGKADGRALVAGL